MHAKPHVMKRLAFVLAASLAVPVLAAPSAARADDGDEDKISLEDFEGAYLFAGGDRERDAIVAEVDDATANLGSMLRGIARKRIKKSQKPSASLFIKVDGEKVTITRSGDKPKFAGQINKGTFVVKKKYTGRIKFKNGKLSVIVSDKESKTTITYNLNPETHRIKVTTKIEHDLLPRPVKVKKTYKPAR